MLYSSDMVEIMHGQAYQEASKEKRRAQIAQGDYMPGII